MSSSQIEALEALLQRKTAANEPEFKLALTRLAAEVNGRMTKDLATSPDFFVAVSHTLAKMKGIGHADIRLKCLLDSASFLFSNGFCVKALEAVGHAKDLSVRARKQSWERKAETVVGVIQADLGNVSEAVICYSKALAIAREIADPLAECAVLLNLGTALIYGGLYREAIPCFRRVIDFSQTDRVLEAYKGNGHSPHELHLCALTNLAQSHSYLGEFEPALAAISLCLSKSGEPKDILSTVSRGIRELTYVRIALRMRRLNDAREHAKLCEYYGSAGGRRAQFFGDITRGLCEVYGGDTHDGIAILERALSLFGDVSSLRVDALEALVEAHEQVGQPGQALEYMKMLLDHIKRARQMGIETLMSLTELDAPKALATESEDLRSFRSKELELRTMVAENEVINARIEMFERLAVAADLKEEVSGAHGYRVGRLASLMGEDMGWSRDACYAIDVASRLHDIGKIGMPDHILFTSKELKDAERHFIGTHTVVGAELLARGNSPLLRMAEEIARHHHEWWNGEGYPSKLAGTRIPLHARIVALADVFDALTHGRPYAQPWPIDRALDDIRSRRGVQFDPELTDRFLALIPRLRAEHHDLDAYLGSAGQLSPFLKAREKIRLVLSTERKHEEFSSASASATAH